MTALDEVTVTEFHETPQIDTQLEKSWIVRAQNFAVRFTRAKAGAELHRSNNPDEYFVLLPEVDVELFAGEETASADKGTLIIVPPGESTIIAKTDGIIISIYSSEATDIFELAANNRTNRSPIIAPVITWPMPEDGYRTRTYRLEDYNRADTLMRLFRTRNLMVNVFRPRDIPRDVRRLSHAHEDFEQGSLSLVGTWTHYIRFPWNSDLTTWRKDQEICVNSPSLTVIPPGAIHTSRNTNEGGSWLVDIFAPPRVDFSRRPGLVCNADEYPLPAEITTLPPLETAD